MPALSVAGVLASSLPLTVARMVAPTGRPSGSVLGCLRTPISTTAVSPGSSRSTMAGTTVSRLPDWTVTASGWARSIQSVPTFSTVTATTCGWPDLSSCLVVERASSSATARPAATGCSVIANTCRLDTPAAGAAVVGRVIAVASLDGSIQTWVRYSDTGCWSVPPGEYRKLACSGPSPEYQSGSPRVAVVVEPSA